MSYQYITKYDSPNYGRVTNGKFYKEGRNAKISFIVIHHWGADGQTFGGVVKYLCRAGGNSSAHYVVESGKVACLVDPKNTAWHAGPKGNPGGIGIECRPEMSQGDLETVAELIANLRKTYGNLPLYPHKKYMATACPGRWEGKLAWLDKRAETIRNGGGITIGAKTPAAQAGYKVKVSINNLNIRAGAGTNHKAVGTCRKGVYTIVATANGTGSRKGWGKLKSGAGWISLDYATRI